MGDCEFSHRFCVSDVIWLPPKLMIQETAMKLLPIFAAVFALALVSAQVMAGVYKCDDGAGNITYSQTPCATDAKEVDMSHAGKSTSGASGESGLRAGEMQALEGIERRKQERLRRKVEEARKRMVDTATSSSIPKSASSTRACDHFTGRLKDAKRDLRRGYTRSNEREKRDSVRHYEEMTSFYCK